MDHPECRRDRIGLKGDPMRWLLIGTMLALMILLAVGHAGA